MAQRTRQEITDRPERKHCPRCTYYLDGKQIVQDDGVSLLFFPTAGMRHYRKSMGNIYDLVGTTTPCDCEAGNLVSEGYKKDAYGKQGYAANKDIDDFFYKPAIQREFTPPSPEKGPELIKDIFRQTVDDF